ncbi:polyamine aminopropyltransferase [Dehalococcoidia bacterium]|nr:polyamine aminopropyltransferase [Dehalococcoidia bacterium]
MDSSGKWLLESVYPDLNVMLKIREVFYSGNTEFQQVEIVGSELFGRSLVLDGKTQSTERDEHIYHESLVHPAMAIHENPKQVFIAGGGEGGTLREVLSHRSVENAVMVDLDPDVVNLCRQYLPQHHQGSFEDQRTTLIHQDARGFLQETDERFDVMIMDLVDPLEGGTAGLLYTEEYYQIAKSKLKPNGILVTQSGPAGLLSYQECFTTIFNTLSQVFDNAVPYHVHVPSFQTLWGFTLASDIDLTLDVDTNDFDATLSGRLNKSLRFYDDITHRNMFALPRFLRDGMRDEKRTNTDSDPVFMV